MEVRDLMTRKVVTVGMDDRLSTVRKLFEQHGFHHLLVVEHRKVVGVISDRDLFKNLSPFIGKPLAERSQDHATLRRRVHQIMTRKLISVPPETSAEQAASLMLEHDVSCLPVLSLEQRPLGIVTARDLLRWALGEFSARSGSETRTALAAALTESSQSPDASSESAPPRRRAPSLGKRGYSVAAPIGAWRDRVVGLLAQIEGGAAGRKDRLDRLDAAVATLARAVLLLLERAETIEEHAPKDHFDAGRPSP